MSLFAQNLTFLSKGVDDWHYEKATIIDTPAIMDTDVTFMPDLHLSLPMPLTFEAKTR